MSVDDPAYRLFQQRFGAMQRSRMTETIMLVATVGLLFLAAAKPSPMPGSWPGV